MGQVERIKIMEARMDAYNELTDDFSKVLKELREAQESWQLLSDYYTSDLWQEDRDLEEKGVLPIDLKCGVLSEDGLYNVLIKNRSLALEMLELATEILKNY